jgi:hypothetical protein
MISNDRPGKREGWMKKFMEHVQKGLDAGGPKDVFERMVK